MKPPVSRPARWRRFSVLGILAMIALFAISCAPIPKAPPDLAARALGFSPDAGRAAIYVIRPGQFVGGLGPLPVFLDHAKLGWLFPKSYFYTEVQPREHVLELAEVYAANSTSKSFKAEADQCYFFEAIIVVGGTRLTLLDPDEGRARVRSSTLSSSTADSSRSSPLVPAR